MQSKVISSTLKIADGNKKSSKRDSDNWSLGFDWPYTFKYSHDIVPVSIDTDRKSSSSEVENIFF